MIKQEEASKYRCKECNKLFKAPEFVIKHIAVKHPEVLNPKLEEVSGRLARRCYCTLKPLADCNVQQLCT